MQSAFHIAAGFTLILTLASCQSGVTKNSRSQDKSQSQDTLYVYDTVVVKDTIYLNRMNNWQRFFKLTHDPNIDSIWGHAVEHYISDPECNALAFDFYYGTFRPMDNASTAELLNLVLEPNDKLRPYYRWCLEKTMEISDGALGEYPGQPARKYAELYPQEFIEYIEQHQDTTNYWLWVDMISYSGLDEYSYDADAAFEGIQKQMWSNCTACPDSIKLKITQFAKDVSKHEP
ncbi:MAG: hypothetical protein JXR19_04055 [Bacteroidia bacterium]